SCLNWSLGRDLPVSRAPLAGGFRTRNATFGGCVNKCSSHADDGNLPARAGALMGRVAVGEIAVRIAIGAASDAVDGDDARSLELDFDESRQVEMGPLARRDMEMAPAIGLQS